MIDRLDHFVLTVRDLAATVDFYERGLGMKLVTFGAGRKALAFGQQKINLHEAGREFEPKASHPVPGSADFCLVTARPLEEVASHLAAVRHPHRKARCRARHLGPDPLPLSPRPGRQPHRDLALRDGVSGEAQSPLYLEEPPQAASRRGGGPSA